MAQQKQQQPAAGKQSGQQMEQKGGGSGQQGEQSQAQGGKSEVQGEGNYTAAKEYDDAQREFVKSGRVEQAARDAAPRSPEEAEQMKAAEREGRSHAKDEDPQLRGKGKPGADGTPRDTQDH
jgi:hypothetical protein